VAAGRSSAFDLVRVWSCTGVMHEPWCALETAAYAVSLFGKPRPWDLRSSRGCFSRKKAKGLLRQYFGLLPKSSTGQASYQKTPVLTEKATEPSSGEGLIPNSLAREGLLRQLAPFPDKA
jgi:hypothetical protein